MLDQGVFDLDWTDPDTAHFEHVVAPPGVPQISVSIRVVFVAGTDPLTGDGLAGLVESVPVAGARGVALDQQVANLAVRHGQTSVVHDLRFVACYRFA